MGSEKIIIVHHDTIGLAHDARVLAAALNHAFSDPIIRYLVIPGQLVEDYSRVLEISKEISDLTPFHFMFLLEHAHSNPPLFYKSFAHKVIYVPNIEWMNGLDEGVIASGRIDMVMLKNKFSFEIFSQLPLTKMVKQVERVGWTSEDVSDINFDLQEKDFNQFFHLRGISVQKQTEIVMEAWANHPEFPLLTIVLRFFGGFELPRPLRYANNVCVYIQEMPSVKLRRLQNAIGIHLCPSRREGFGHSLNEARATSSVLVTTDGPPMNELVTHGENGFLVPVNPDQVSSVRRSLQFNITSDRLAEQIDNLLSMPYSRRKEMGRLSRQKFLSERDGFYQSITKFRDLARG
jgi:glycosyltransferase involved in cell wall biosynthesis